MQFHVYIAVAPGLAFASAFGVIVMIVDSIQMFRRFAFLAQAVVQTDQKLRIIPAACASSRILASINFLRG